MATLTTKLVQLKKQLAAAERREQIQQQERAAAVAAQILTPYSGRGDLFTYYVQSFKDPELVIKIDIPEQSLTKCLGGATQAQLTAIGGSLTVPVGTAVASRKGFTSHYYRLKFIHLKATPTAKLTKWGTRVVTYHDKDGDQAFREIPMGGDMKQVEAKAAAIMATPAPFTRGIIQLISNTGDVVRSKRVG